MLRRRLTILRLILVRLDLKPLRLARTAVYTRRIGNLRLISIKSIPQHTAARLWSVRQQVVGVTLGTRAHCYIAETLAFTTTVQSAMCAAGPLPPDASKMVQHVTEMHTSTWQHKSVCKADHPALLPVIIPHADRVLLTATPLTQQNGFLTCTLLTSRPAVRVAAED